MPPPTGAQQLLDALDGVAYLTDAVGTIRMIGTPSWDRFASDNNASALTADAAIGTSLFAHIEGTDVAAACRRLHDQVCGGRPPTISYGYRCDAPGMERRMRMSISPVVGRRGSGMVLYQSQMLLEMPRLPLGLLSMDRRGVLDRTKPHGDPVVICSFCHDVAWPIGAHEADQTWIRIDDYYRRGGRSEVLVSHGICPGCTARLLDPHSD
jgi:hypothetical protein